MGFHLSFAPPRAILASAGMLRIPQAIPEHRGEPALAGRERQEVLPSTDVHGGAQPTLAQSQPLMDDVFNVAMASHVLTLSALNRQSG